MSKVSKKTAKSVAKVAKAEVKKAKVTRNFVADGAKINWLAKAVNPFREGSEVWKRVELVRKNSGKTRETIEKLKGVRVSTVPALVRAGLVREVTA
jgi:hypothetical protein